MGMWIFFGLLLAATIANIVGPEGAGVLRTREATWVLTVGLLVAMLVTAGRTVHSRWDGIFIDRDNRISLSRLQLIIWTALIISALFTGALTNMTARVGNPLGIDVPEEIWALLGLGAFTAIAAPVIKENQKRAAFRAPETAQAPNVSGGQGTASVSGSQAVANEIKADQGLTNGGWFVNRVFVKATPAEARWVDLINGDYEGAAQVDVSKLQQLLFTVLLAITYGSAIWLLMRAGNFKAFPEVYPEFVTLLGISQATYLADKQLNTT